ncbi:MAG: cell division protein SepF [Bacilli bacterium]
MGFMNKFIKDNDEEEMVDKTNISEDYYTIKSEEATAEDGKSKMILLEPRAYSETLQIIDHLKNRNAVVVNLKRVTATQGKRIVDVLYGATYAIDGLIQKIGTGIFLLTPNNVNIQGQISDDKDAKDSNQDDVEW